MIQFISWLFAGLLLGVPISFVLLFQDRFIYFPVRYSPTGLQEAKRIGVQKIDFQTSQGAQAAFFWQREPAHTAPQKVWIVFGGNGSIALGWLETVRDFAVPRTGFLLIDYPGYGICEGKPNPRSILENPERALRALQERMHWNLEANALGVLGHSLGAAAALQFAAKHPVSKIVLLSPFTTVDEMVRRQIHISLGPLLRQRFDNIASLKAILSHNLVPEIYIFHGEQDEVIPLHMGRTLSQLDPGRINFVVVVGAHHNDVIEMALPSGLQSALSAKG
jgi:uncharacterized protein